VNSKQIIAVVSAIALVVMLAYPALSTATVSILIRSTKIENADHVYVTVGNIWIHRAGQPSSDGWELVSNRSLTLDLSSLENTTVAFAKGQVSLGTYDTIRMQVSNATWVFNKTTTSLSIEFSQVQTKLDFTVPAGRESTITLVLTGHQEQIGETKFFTSNLNATVYRLPST
jgi:hypothetical protein